MVIARMRMGALLFPPTPTHHHHHHRCFWAAATITNGGEAGISPSHPTPR